MKRSLLAITIALLTVGGSARAALEMSGSLGVIDFPNGGAFTSSSLILSPSSLVTTETGTFASLVPGFSDVVSYIGTLRGLSATPITEDINNLFILSTTSSDRLEFDLGSLSEVAYNSSQQTAAFIGTGTLVDSLGIYASSPAEFGLTFSAQGNYSFVLSTTAIPEPNQYGIYSGVFAFLLVLSGPLRRRFSGRKF